MKKILFAILISLFVFPVKAEDEFTRIDNLLKQNVLVKDFMKETNNSKHNNKRVGISKGKANNLIGNYRITAYDQHYENLIIKNVNHINKNLIRFTYDLRFTDNSLKVSNQDGAIVNGVMIIHSPIIYTHNIYILKPKINRRGVSASGLMNSFDAVILCEDNFTPVFNPSFLSFGNCGVLHPNLIDQNTFSLASINKI